MILGIQENLDYPENLKTFSKFLDTVENLEILVIPIHAPGAKKFPDIA